MRLKDLAHYERIRAIAAHRGCGTYKIGGGYNVMDNSKLTTSVGDYREVEILPDSVIYCDPPYLAAREYKHNKEAFDHEALYLFCERQTQPIFISEYDMPEDRFFCIAEFDRVSTFSATNNSKRVVEKIYMPMKWKSWWESHKPTQQLSIFDL